MRRQILTLEEVSALTRLPLNTLRWMRHQGTGPPTWKLGRRVVAYEDEVQAWLQDEYQRTRNSALRSAPPKVASTRHRTQETATTAPEVPGISRPHRTHTKS